MGRIYDHLSAEGRGVIMAMLAQGSSARAMAAVLGRAPSTVARELMRAGARELRHERDLDLCREWLSKEKETGSISTR